MEWLNLDKYSLTALIITLIGSIFWSLAYVNILLNVKKYKYVDVPILAICANIAWEFIWSFIFMPDLGYLFVWGFRVWFFLDVFIVIALFKYGYKQFRFKLTFSQTSMVYIFMIVSWFVIFITFTKAGFDTGSGAVGAYMDNIMMSGLYITLKLNDKKNKGISFYTGLYKFVGTALISVAVVITFPQRYFLLSLCVIAFILDVWYVSLFDIFKRNKTISHPKK